MVHSPPGFLKPIILVPNGDVIHARPKRSLVHRLMPSGRIAAISLVIILCFAIVAVIVESLVWSGLINQINFSYWAQANNDAGDFSNLNTLQNSKPVVVYNALMITGLVFTSVAWWDAAGALLIFNLFLLAYSIVQYYEVPTLSYDEVNIILDRYPQVTIRNTLTYEFVLVGILSLWTLLMLALGFPLYREFSWSFYKKLGADVDIKRMNLHHLVLTTLLKMDSFFLLAFVIQLLAPAIVSGNFAPWSRLIAAFPLVVAIVTIGAIGLNREQHSLMMGFIVGLGFVLGYVILEVTLMATRANKPNDPYAYCRIFVTFLGVINITLIFMSFGYGLRCYRNFDHGLKAARRRSALMTSGEVVTTSTKGLYNRSVGEKASGSNGRLERTAVANGETETSPSMATLPPRLMID
ncbi:hypothetical protein IWQ60_002231 [Tieghemiomyces parasiticus]|uniref:Uncharacterized protein n=1 Tax=Tieghemiomyces parasiticus TaxID=78921 RepID=A0A9W8DVW4_9FUNG|nr:hypothetical protein IWQ60_002231 [Tieghemiomyces parasiticus]